MQVSLLLCCDYASVSKDNKLNAMGIFSKLYLPKFPFKHPQMYLVIQLRARPAEYGRQFKLGIRLIDQDAIQHLVKIDANLRIPSLKGVSRAEINHVMRLNNVHFQEPGPYDFSVLIDNDVKAALPIEVLKMPERKKGASASSSNPLVPEDDTDSETED